MGKQLCHESLERKKITQKIHIYSFIYSSLPVPCLHHAWTKNFSKSYMTGTSKNLTKPKKKDTIIDITNLTRPQKTRPKRPFLKIILRDYKNVRIKFSFKNVCYKSSQAATPIIT